MKLIIPIIILLLSIPCYLNGQNYTQAAGLRGGNTPGITYRQNIDEGLSYEGIFTYRNNGLIATVIKEYCRPYSFDFSDHLFFCYGYGGHIGYRYESYYESIFGTFNYYDKKITPVFGMDGYLAFEYRIEEIPFIVALDYKPFFEFSTRQIFHLQLADIAFALKYRF